MFSRSLLVLRGDEWREMRHHLSPAFTGSKLRGMADLMADSGRQFIRFLAKRPDPEEPIEMREAFRRFVADVIATTAYGTEFDSINDPNNEFFKYANNVLNMKGLRGLVLAGYIISPKLMEILGIPLIPQNMKEYFFNLILGSMKYREEQNKVRKCCIYISSNFVVKGAKI